MVDSIVIQSVQTSTDKVLRRRQNIKDINIKIGNTALSLNYCPYCNSSFDSFYEFSIHMSNMHQQKKTFQCTMCTATFRRRDHLKRHITCLHSDTKYSKCPACDQEFNNRDSLFKHIRKLHQNDTLTCRECPNQYNCFTDLEKHEATHTLLMNRHECPHCNSLFKRRDHMLRHVNSQHLNHFVTCPVCSQSYKRKDHLVRHVREKHHMGYINGQLFKASDML